MDSKCKLCNDSGYLDVSPVTYCDCNAGIFYETKDELHIQFEAGELDCGQDDTDSEDLCSMYEEDVYSMYEDDINLWYLDQLAFSLT